MEFSLDSKYVAEEGTILLSVVQAIASGVNITFEILYNGAVAMTGGQHVVDGSMPIAKLVRRARS